MKIVLKTGFWGWFRSPAPGNLSKSILNTHGGQLLQNDIIPFALTWEGKTERKSTHNLYVDMAAEKKNHDQEEKALGIGTCKKQPKQLNLDTAGL